MLRMRSDKTRQIPAHLCPVRKRALEMIEDGLVVLSVVDHETARCIKAAINEVLEQRGLTIEPGDSPADSNHQQ